MRAHRPCCIALALCSAACAAHPAAAPEAAPWFLSWNRDPLVLLPMLAALLLYLAGLRRLHPRSATGRALRRTRAAAFMLGWLVLGIALVSPLDALGGLLFSAHMVQHELLMLAAAPLLVLGRPLAVWLWAFPAGTRARIGRFCTRAPLHAAWRWLTRPASAWALHALALWAWHLPRLFDAAWRDPGIHALQHISFLASALLFWWTVLGSRAGSATHGFALLSLFTTMAHTGALGALLTLSPVPWYASSLAAGATLGFDALEDQQLGGLVMWVPGGLAYLAGGLVVAAQMLRRRGGPETAR